MKRRGWRVALTVAAIGLALVAGLVAFNWQTVRTHAEAWWFVATRETKSIRPFSNSVDVSIAVDVESVFQELANLSGKVIVFDPKTAFDFAFDWNPESKDDALKNSQEHGFRIIEQRFPRRAYVVVGYSEPEPDLESELEPGPEPDE